MKSLHWLSISVNLITLSQTIFSVELILECQGHLWYKNLPYHTICSRVLRKKSHKKTKKTLHISLRNALLAIINNISVFAKLWTIFTEILEHQYFETITLHRSVTRQAWINVFLTTQLGSADHPLYLDMQTFFFLLVFFV